MNGAELLETTRQMVDLAKRYPLDKGPLPHGWSGNFLPTLADFINSESYPTLLGRIYSMFDHSSGRIHPGSVDNIVSWLFEWIGYSHNKVSCQTKLFATNPLQTKTLYSDPRIRPNIGHVVYRPQGIRVVPIEGTTYIAGAHITSTSERRLRLDDRRKLNFISSGQIARDLWNSQPEDGRLRVTELISEFFPGLPERIAVADKPLYKPFILLPKGTNNTDLTTIRDLPAFRVPVTREQLIALIPQLFPEINKVTITSEI